ncbi:GNAT family N-acetyltransferase [Dactylosporangium sp. NPDC049140]|jgi:GNAT superfamily N-acetyltransferase|uniref:GNAT family N-acetyltransferase n=1 Tax=Dactylosporangium sp. NPDC049140 TaxID=3155647 RepID=UPI00340393DF
MTTWESGPLRPEHELEGFDCTDEALNSWLRQAARRVNDDGLAKVYVWTASGSHIVKAYYAVMPHAVAKSDLTSKQAKGSNSVPGYLIAKLALHRDLHGDGLGGELLLDALENLVEAADRGGGRLVVVDAISDAAAGFYRHYGFKPVTLTERRLVTTIAEARMSLGMASLTVAGDGRLGLATVVYKGPDGRPLPFVGDASDLRQIADRLEEISAQRGAAGDDRPVDLAAVMIDVLGRNPFTG